MNNLKPAFVLSGHTMALGVVRALGKMGVPIIMLHYNEKDMGHVSKYITHSVFTPNPEKFETAFISKLIECGQRYGSGVLFPVSDETVVAVAKNKDRLDNLFTVACPDWEVSQKFIEKKYTYALADENGIPSPKTIIANSIEDVEHYVEQAQFPCLVKPSQSHLFYNHFKRKMFPVENAAELISVYNQATDAGLEVVLQEIITGDDMNVANYNAYFFDGVPLLEFTAQQIRSAPPQWGSPRVVLSKAIPEIIEPGRKILQAMNFNGYACVEFKKEERTGIYKLVEVNGRHNLSTSLAVHCGINFPYLQYKHLLENEIPAARSFKKDIYWIDITRDIGYSLMFFRQERYSIKQYLRPYFKPHVFAIFDLKDFKPFLKRVSFLMKQALGSMFGFIFPSKKKEL